MYDELMDIWRSGDFQFNFGSGSNNCSSAHELTHEVTEQDLLVEYFLKREKGRYVGLPPAGGWGSALALGRGGGLSELPGGGGGGGSTLLYTHANGHAR